MMFRTSAPKLDGLKDSVAGMVRELGCKRDKHVRKPPSWRMWATCGLCKDELQLRDFEAEELGPELLFEDRRHVDFQSVDVDVDNISVSKETKVPPLGYPWAVLVDFTVRVPVEPFTHYFEQPAERIVVLKTKHDMLKSLNSHLKHLPTVQDLEVPQVSKETCLFDKSCLLTLACLRFAPSCTVGYTKSGPSRLSWTTTWCVCLCVRGACVWVCVWHVLRTCRC